MSHTVIIEFDGGPTYSLHCDAPADAECRTQFYCGCESWSTSGVENGRPWHAGEDERHYGEFAAGWCNVTAWFEEAEGEVDIVGRVSFAVDEEWKDDHFAYRVVGETTVEKLTADREHLAGLA